MSLDPVTVGSDAAEVGQPLPDNVVVEVDYAIIRHFSEYLYGSPNKAVEELVSNGYDALANECRVYIPGSLATGRVVVWDDGQSMGVQDLKALWVIARSPKEAQPSRVAEADGLRRLMIGKFGIGKLASYALGERITHYCHLGEDYLAVTVDYRDVHTDLSSGDADPTNASAAAVGNQIRRYATPIRRLTKEEARKHLGGLFAAEPEAMRALFERPHWTVAVVDRLKADVELSKGRLMWVLGNGMPLRPDFRLFVNDEEVQSRLGAGAITAWTLAEPSLHEALASAWTKSTRAPGRNAVEGEFLLPGQLWPQLTEEEHDATVPRGTVVLPHLGPVSATVRLFNRSLVKGEDDQPRSYGFFVMVRGRLINPDDDRLLLSDPSFAAFYRMQIVIHADRLDQDLLADRERIREETPRGRELGVLQHALYLAARLELDRQDVEAAVAATTESLLPVDSRELFREPLTALLLRDESGVAAFSLSRPSVRRAELSEDEHVSGLASDGSGFVVNSAHPFYRAVRTKAGDGKKAKEFLRVFDLFAVSERLLEGHLYDTGLEAHSVQEVLSWRDRLFRSLAGRYETASEVIPVAASA